MLPPPRFTSACTDKRHSRAPEVAPISLRLAREREIPLELVCRPFFPFRNVTECEWRVLFRGPGAIRLLNGLYDPKIDHQSVVAVVAQSARQMTASFLTHSKGHKG